jgi:hypothetical protein
MVTMEIKKKLSFLQGGDEMGELTCEYTGRILYLS